jgi:hypothetical protein
VPERAKFVIYRVGPVRCGSGLWNKVQIRSKKKGVGYPQVLGSAGESLTKWSYAHLDVSTSGLFGG